MFPIAFLPSSGFGALPYSFITKETIALIDFTTSSEQYNQLLYCSSKNSFFVCEFAVDSTKP